MRMTRWMLSLSLITSLAGCGDDDGDPTPTPDAGVTLDSGIGGEEDSGTPDEDSGTPAEADVELEESEELGSYLVDAEGKTLYFFVNDTAGSDASACTQDPCLSAWPPFYAEDITVGEGLNAAGFGEITRPDDSTQTTWRGRPLYYFANDTEESPTAGDGAQDGRWFVARAYDVFFASSAALEDTDVTPLGAEEAGAPFLTNGAGRTAYMFGNDTPADGGDPTSDCMGGCLTAWPVWQAPADLEALVLPSALDAADFSSFTNENPEEDVTQLVYKGWPLYYFNADDEAGEVAGAEMANWWTVNPAWDAADPTPTP